MKPVQSKGTALITGASSGIGAIYAERLATRGYDLLLVARDEQRLEAAATRLRTEHAVQVEVLKADLTLRADLLKVEQRLRSDSNISLLLNNAGIAADGPLASADMDQMERSMWWRLRVWLRLRRRVFRRSGGGRLLMWGRW